MANIKQNIENIKKVISNLNKETKIVGVTKSVDVERIVEAIEAGLTDFGENKVQEAIPKIEILKHKNIKWHFIGHLQSNKINKTIKYFNIVQSIDTVELAMKMSEALARDNMSIDAFIEVKVSREPTKFGASPEQILRIIEKISKLKNINLYGFMAIAPYSENVEDARPYFKIAKSLFDEIKRNYSNENVKMQYLSMGMTDDYVVAIEEGANMVRIGTGIFGNRIIK